MQKSGDENLERTSFLENSGLLSHTAATGYKAEGEGIVQIVIQTQPVMVSWSAAVARLEYKKSVVQNTWWAINPSRKNVTCHTRY